MRWYIVGGNLFWKGISSDLASGIGLEQALDQEGNLSTENCQVPLSSI